MNRVSIIARIKKCMALGQSSNPHEAALALKKAQELMEEHNVTLVDVSLSDVGETEVAMSQAQKPASYIVTLTNTVAEAFGCKVMGKPGWRQTRISFIGLETQSEIAAYAFDVLRRALTRARKEYLKTIPKQTKAKNKTLRADAFCKGWVWGVIDEIEALAIPDETTNAIKRWMEREYPDTETQKCRKVEVDKNINTMVAGAKGYAEGKKQYLHRPIDGSGTTPARLTAVGEVL